MQDDIHLHQTHPDVVKRLRRAEGHLRRVISMIEEARPCLDVAQQLHAVEKALGEAKKTLIHDHVDHCLDAAANGQGKTARSVVNEFRAISRYL
jgi:DNA-binding FrmR family transcriptional regulator